MASKNPVSRPAPCGIEILSCPSLTEGGIASEIRRRGNVPMAVGSNCVVELTPADVTENWQSAKAVRRQVAGAMAAELGHRLCQSFSEEDDTTLHAGEAAACFFLSLHHEGIPLKQALKGCRVLWDERRYAEQVECFK